MMDKQWLQTQFEQWIQECKDYKERAFLQQALELLLEQQKRLEQQQGQLDGQLWSPKEW